MQGNSESSGSEGLYLCLWLIPTSTWWLRFFLRFIFPVTPDITNDLFGYAEFLLQNIGAENIRLIIIDSAGLRICKSVGIKCVQNNFIHVHQAIIQNKSAYHHIPVDCIRLV